MIFAGILLILAVAVLGLCCAGMIRARGFLNQLHFLGPAGVLGAPLLAVAVMAGGHSAQAGIKGATVALILAIGGPVTGHALARAHRVRSTGKIEATKAEIKRGNLER